MNLYIKYNQIERFIYRVVMFLHFCVDKNTTNKFDFTSDNTCIVDSGDGQKKFYSFLTYKKGDNKEYLQKSFAVYAEDQKGKSENQLKDAGFTRLRLLNNDSLKVTNSINELLSLLQFLENSKEELFLIFFNEFIKPDANLSNNIFYKYKSNDGYGVQELIDGTFTYVNPIKFNDPFDCDFDISISKSNYGGYTSLKEEFRVLSLSSYSDQILMWGYYAKDHTGICVGQKLNSYFESTKREYSGLIVYGNVEYDDVRPSYKYNPGVTTVFPFVKAFSKMCQCCFTKYKKWEHEGEFRILTFKNGFSDQLKNDDFINIKGTAEEWYVGCNYNGTHTFPSSYYKYEKDTVDYKLI